MKHCEAVMNSQMLIAAKSLLGWASLISFYEKIRYTTTIEVIVERTVNAKSSRYPRFLVNNISGFI
jgi:hypothetical protein